MNWLFSLGDEWNFPSYVMMFGELPKSFLPQSQVNFILLVYRKRKYCFETLFLHPDDPSHVAVMYVVHPSTTIEIMQYIVVTAWAMLVCQ